MAGCSTTGSQTNNSAVAPQIPTPSPYAPGQAPPPGYSQPGVVVPGGPPPGVPQAVAPSSPEDARVQFTAARLNQANPWLKVRPRWIVSQQESPGITAQSEQTVIISAHLVRASSDGQLAAAMSLQLGDLMASRQVNAQAAVRQQRETTPPPDYYPAKEGMGAEIAMLNVNEAAKLRSDPRDLRRKEQQQQLAPVDPSTCARQILAQAGYSQGELEQAAPILQRYPLVRPSVR